MFILNIGLYDTKTLDSAEVTLAREASSIGHRLVALLCHLITVTSGKVLSFSEPQIPHL